MPSPAHLALLAAGGGIDYWIPPIGTPSHLWDVSKVSTVTTSDLGGGIVVIERVANQHAAGIDMVCAAAGKKPIMTTTNGRQSGNFDGSDDFMQCPSTAIDGDQTIFVVCDITSTAVKILLEHSANWNTNNGQLINPNSSSEMGYGIRRSSSNSARFATTTTTGLHVWTFRADGTHANQTIRKDGSNLSTTSVGAGYNNNVGTGTVTDTLYLGARSANSLQIAMTFGVALIYNTTLSDGDCATTEASLKSWWGTP